MEKISFEAEAQPKPDYISSFHTEEHQTNCNCFKTDIIKDVKYRAGYIFFKIFVGNLFLIKKAVPLQTKI